MTAPPKTRYVRQGSEELFALVELSLLTQAALVPELRSIDQDAVSVDSDPLDPIGNLVAKTREPRRAIADQAARTEES